MNLVIVESPAKGRTIEKYLGHDFKVLACLGHIRDLPKSKIGVDVKNNFEPTYEIPPKAKKVIKLLKSEISAVNNLYLATDYDREGEAIAWHLVEAIKPRQKVERITFTEITKPAINEAMKHPRKIDLNLVDAQQARRVLDRLVGYKLSPFLWQKVARGLSAGRVQSVAVRLIVEREREIKKFDPEEYWNLEAKLSKDAKRFTAQLTHKDGKKLDKLAIKNEDDARKIEDTLKSADYLVADIKKEEKKRYPAPPFTTSTLQQEAGSKLRYSAKQTMKLAQNLYEDGLITYMRTDSLNVSPLALKQAHKVISEKFGENYALATPRFYKTKSKGAQEAHEAIRPTDLSKTVVQIPLSEQHRRLYDLIWKKMLASQMKEASVDETAVKIQASNFGFLAIGLKIKFPGFMKLYKTTEETEAILPELAVGDKLTLEKLEKIQHFTEPPPRYSEGSLIKELEKRGIGRPSTYAPTLSTIQDRGYVEKVQGKFIPKDIGEAVNDMLEKHFPDIVDYNFTAKMEDNLDDIAEGKLEWRSVIRQFYQPFAKDLSEKMATVQKNGLEEKTKEKCPKCGKILIIKIGRFGKFIACSGYPECKFTQPLLTESEKVGKKVAKETSEKCPKCGQNLVLKEGKFGPFSACLGFPKCRFTKNIEITAAVACPNCHGKLLKKYSRKGKAFWGCQNFPKCRTAFWDEPQKELCPKCQNIVTFNSRLKLLKCSQCDYVQNHS